MDIKRRKKNSKCITKLFILEIFQVNTAYMIPSKSLLLIITLKMGNFPFLVYLHMNVRIFFVSPTKYCTNFGHKDCFKKTVFNIQFVTNSRKSKLYEDNKMYIN